MHCSSGNRYMNVENRYIFVSHSDIKCKQAFAYLLSG